MNDLEFSDSEIKSVASELGLPEDAFDDHERIGIINNWKSTDIVACPGSGKTTVLLAKLLLLSRRASLDNSKGVCVLTHTNIAIDEIKAKLGQRAGVHFNHPNFFGTIQSFVDRFLTIPCCAKTHSIRPRIQNSKYFEELKSNYNSEFFPKGFFVPKRGYDYFKKLRYNFDNIAIISNGLFGDAFCDKDSKTYKKTVEVKKKITKKGVICFDDAFSIANWYLYKYPSLKNYFSSRFKFLFIDEMQDTQAHQLEILKKIFDDRVVKQFYGDPDQAIFDGIAGGVSAWKINENRMEITDSKRFGKSISTCIYPFRKEISKVEGTAKDSLKPYIILYEKPEEALKKFAILVTQTHKLHQLQEYKNWNKPSSPLNAVGFVGKDDDQKVTIKNYFKVYSKETSSGKKHFSNLISYFQKRPCDETLKHGTRIYHQLFINAFIVLLDKSGCKNPVSNRNFTNTSLLKYLREKDKNILIEFQEKIAKWIKDLYCDEKKPDQVKSEFIEFFQETLKDTFSEFDDSIFNKDFTKENEICIKEIDRIKKEGNIAEIDGIEIKVGTVHSVKGETHLATLFFETQNYGNFETDYFFSEKSGNLFCNGKYKQPKNHLLLERRMKTTYVAISRPSHLLCVALNKNRAKCVTCSEQNTQLCNWRITETD